MNTQDIDFIDEEIVAQAVADNPKSVTVGYDGDVNRALVFGELVKLATPAVEHYHSDLYHDATWLRDWLPLLAGDEPIVFYYGTRDTGTMIGTDGALIARYTNRTYKLTLNSPDRLGRITLTIEPLDGSMS